MERDRNEDVVVNAPNPEKIACRNCKWAINGAMKCNCLKFADKPASVYYRNEDCPEFKQK